MSRTYPFTAYVLTPAMLVKKIELARKSDCWGGGGGHEAVDGKWYSDSDLHETPKSAIASGRAALEGQRAKLAKQQENIEKRAANLAKAEASHD